MAETAVLALGSNLGERRENILGAVRLISQRIGEVELVSEIIESEPWGEVEGIGGEQAGWFLNAAAVVRTELEPLELLSVVKDIEFRMGRAIEEAVEGAGEKRKYCSRIIDIDIIYYGDRIVDLPELKVPHPLIAEREFVLEPLARVLPRSVHPVTGLTPGEMLRKLKNKNICAG